MFRPQRLFSLGTVAVLTLIMAACGSRHDSDENYYLVGSNIKTPVLGHRRSGFFHGGIAAPGAS